MTGKGHTATGVVFCLFPALIAYSNAGLIPAILAALSCIVGATAPDWMEIPITSKNKNNKTVTRRIIAHRTWTHVISWWGAGVIYSYYSLTGWVISIPYIEPLSNSTAAAALLGFGCGGLVHLVWDIPNKQKIPIFTPLDGVALNLWKSGKYEGVCIFLTATTAVILSLNEIGMI